MPYLVLRRQAAAGELESCFALLYEPYPQEPFLAPNTIPIHLEKDAVQFKAQLKDGAGSFALTCRDVGPSGVVIEGVRELAGTASSFRLTGISTNAAR